MMRALLVVVALALCSPTDDALPCRFTVRDIGFIDLHGPEYTLRMHVPQGMAGSESLSQAWQRRLSTSNVRFELELVPGQLGWKLSLERDGLSSLKLASGAPRRASSESLPWSETVLQSALRQRLLAETLQSFATILILEGSDEPAREAAEQIVREARAKLAEFEPQLPRPIEHPIRVLKLEASSREQERVLLWSLGLPPHETDTAVAVVYGRGKLAGSVLRHTEITTREVLTQLAIVGESCECETSRAWASEPRLPLDWSERLQTRTAESLGFDPNSPLVRAEVAQILAREGSKRSTGSRSLESLLLGYEEAGLPTRPDEVDRARSASGSSGAVELEGSGRLTKAVPEVSSGGEGDWDFVESPPRHANLAAADSDLSATGRNPSATGPDPTLESSGGSESMKDDAEEDAESDSGSPSLRTKLRILEFLGLVLAGLGSCAVVVWKLRRSRTP